MSESTRGYVKVADDGTARFYPPLAGRWTGGSVKVSVSAPPGWYRARCEFDASGACADLGRRVDPVVEAERLLALAAKSPTRARTRSPGIAGYQHAETMATAALAVRRQTQRYFADLLAGAQP